MKPVKVLFLLTIITVMVSCYSLTGDSFKYLVMGEDYEGVIEDFGAPSGMSLLEDGTLRIVYLNVLVSVWGWDKADYYIDFKDNKLVGYGALDVRSGNSPIITAITI